MAIKCPQCGAEYDVTLFTFGRSIHCDCGAWVDLKVGHQQKGEDGNKASVIQNQTAVDTSINRRTGTHLRSKSNTAGVLYVITTQLVS